MQSFKCNGFLEGWYPSHVNSRQKKMLRGGGATEGHTWPTVKKKTASRKNLSITLNQSLKIHTLLALKVNLRQKPAPDILALLPLIHEGIAMTTNPG